MIYYIYGKLFKRNFVIYLLYFNVNKISKHYEIFGNIMNILQMLIEI